ncbi:hypothetical protein HK098_000941 [Nowakowskiella sp. JEL0407]|nr:hypothetical protein HK098_000941 [Nowakowskiella sp. JEL0407]
MFEEFMSELLPLLNTRSIKQRIQRLLPKRFIRDQSNAVPEDICLICMRNSKSLDVSELSEWRIVVPWRTQCGHVYCYYCLKSSLMDDSKFMCLRCGETVTEIAEATTEIRDAITPVPVVDE